MHLSAVSTAHPRLCRSYPRPSQQHFTQGQTTPRGLTGSSSRLHGSSQSHQLLNRAGRVQNVLAAAQRRSKDVADKLAYQQGESGKLDQRLEAALSQWQAGLSKTRATAGQMQSLASSVRPPAACERALGLPNLYYGQDLAWPAVQEAETSVRLLCRAALGRVTARQLGEWHDRFLASSPVCEQWDWVTWRGLDACLWFLYALCTALHCIALDLALAQPSAGGRRAVLRTIVSSESEVSPCQHLMLAASLSQAEHVA